MKTLKRITIALVIFFLFSITFVYFFQESLIFFKQSLSDERLEWLRTNYPQAEEVILETPEGIKLHGWFVKSEGEKMAPLVIFFGGNGQEVSEVLELADGFKGWSLLVVNYRGYGLSQGEPGQEEIFKDALFLYDSFKDRKDIDSDRIVAMGWSLGSGAAVYVAENREIAGTILVSPYDSIKKVAARKIPFLPMQIMLRHPFDSLSRAPSINVPALALVGSEDKVVAPSHSSNLMSSWGGEWQLEVMEGRGHVDIHLSDEFWEHINDFLGKR